MSRRTQCATITVFTVLAWSGTCLAGPVSLTFSPLTQVVTTGQLVSIDAVISGIGGVGAREVGSFDIFVGFDSALLSPTNVSFGALLGDESNFEALTDFSFNFSSVEAAEVSLLSNADLDARQTASFPLATFSFTALSEGVAQFQFLGGPIDDGNGILIAGTKTPVPEPGTGVLFGIAFVALIWLLGPRRRRGAGNRIMRPGSIMRISAWAIVAAAWICLLQAAVSPKIPLKDSKDAATGIEYQVGTTNFPKTKAGAQSQNLVTPITLYNTTNAVQRVIVCSTGVSADLGDNFKHMKIQMKLAANKFTCDIPNAQNLAARKERLGAMGCRLITIPANGKADAQFVSGNDRTIPKFDAKMLPVAGQFNVVGGFGGVGPTQTGTIGSGIAAGAGWGLVGGHPGVSASAGKAVSKVLDDLYLHFILLQDVNLDLDADPSPPPARDKGSFNCNKCFGMGPDGLGTGLGQFRGYHLEPLAAADRKNTKAIFINHWIKYQTLELKKAEVLTASLNIYNDFTYFADTVTQSQYTIDASGLPPACSLAGTGPTPPLSVFTVSPQEAKRVAVQVFCNSNLNPGDEGQLVLTLSSLDNPEAPEITSKHFLRLVAPRPCDVNADGTVDSLDIDEIMSLRGTAVEPGNKYDIDGDLLITTNDARRCTLSCTLPLCAIPAPPQ